MDSAIKAIVVSATRDILERHVTNVRKEFLPICYVPEGSMSEL